MSHQRILVGDVREVLAALEPESVQCVVTSPPYYGLRDYGVPGQIGLEPTLAEYLASLVGVFREVRRVLRPDGTVWVNLGDSYAANRTYQVTDNKHRDVGNNGGMRVPEGMKPKDLMLVPARFAIAMQEDGWWLRSDVIWSKPNPMPESVTDRPTSAHEHVFLFAKSARYYYDAESVRTPTKMPALNNGYSPPGQSPHTGGRKVYDGKHTDKQRGHSRRHDGFSDRWDLMTKAEQQAMGANMRNVWHIAPQPFPEAHFATFPTEIPRLCIKAGSKPGDTIMDPFVGSGTTLVVADQLDRDGIGIELNPEYAEMARRRVANTSPLWSTVEVA